jgi:uncharacterized protein (TIGR02058 family)
MTAKRVILELGSGNDLHGGDYTKAALRAIEDAVHHSSLALFRSLGLDPEGMEIEATIGVARPERVDAEKIKRAFPYGQVSVRVVKGGLDVPREGGEDALIASAAIAVRIDLSSAARSL